MISFLRDERCFWVPPPYGGEIAPPKPRVVELVSEAEIFDQRDCFIRYANADMAARKVTPLDHTDVEPHFGQPNGG
jgi:hypothetical protein